MITHSFNSSASAAREDKNNRPLTVHLTYVAGVCERIRMMWKDFNSKTVFKFGSTLCSLLSKVKNNFSLEKQANAVYKVWCTWKRCRLARLRTIRIETYLKEHKLGNVCQRPRYNSTTAEQAWSRSEYHPICCKAMRKLQCASWTMVPVVKEAISSLIRRHSVCT